MKSIALYLWKMKSNKKIRFHYDPWAPEIKGLHFIEVRFDCWNIREKLIFFLYFSLYANSKDTIRIHNPPCLFAVMYMYWVSEKMTIYLPIPDVTTAIKTFFFHLVIIFIKVVCMLMCISWLTTKTSKSGELLLEITNIQGSVARNGKLKS